MAFTYDFESAPQISYVRMLVPDTDPENEIFSDSEIMAAYTIQASVNQSAQFYTSAVGSNLPSLPVSYFRVAAILLDIIASNKAKLSTITKLLDVQLNAAEAVAMFRDQATKYREIDDNSGAFAIVEQVNDSWSFRDRWWRQFQRMSGGM